MGGVRKAFQKNGGVFFYAILSMQLFNFFTCGHLPSSDRAGVNMDEIGIMIISDAALIEVNGNIPQIGSQKPGNSDIRSLPFHMIALFGDTAAVISEHLIRLGTSVSTDQMNRCFPGCLLGYAME